MGKYDQRIILDPEAAKKNRERLANAPAETPAEEKARKRRLAKIIERDKAGRRWRDRGYWRP